MTVWKVKLVVNGGFKDFRFNDHAEVIELIALMTKGAEYCHFAVEQEVREEA